MFNQQSTNIFAQQASTNQQLNTNTNTNIFQNPNQNQNALIQQQPQNQNQNQNWFWQPQQQGQNIYGPGNTQSAQTAGYNIGLTQNQLQNGSSFGTTNQSNPQNISNNIFSKPSSTPANFTFGGALNTTSMLPQNQTLLNQSPQTNLSSTLPILSLQPTNVWRFNNLSTMNDTIKKAAERIETDWINNTISLTTSEQLLTRIEWNYPILKNECWQFAKFIKLWTDENDKISFLVSQYQRENQKLRENIDRETNNFRMLQTGSDFKIQVPSYFMLSYAQELANRMKEAMSQIENIQCLIDLCNGEESDRLQVNDELIDEVIANCYASLKLLIKEHSKLEEIYDGVVISYKQLIMSKEGLNESQVEARWNGFLEDQVEKQV